MIRIPPDILKRIDTGAKRLGLSRAAFIVQSAAEKLERME
jgi:predicted DNA-binding protein